MVSDVNNLRPYITVEEQASVVRMQASARGYLARKQVKAQRASSASPAIADVDISSFSAEVGAEVQASSDCMCKCTCVYLCVL